MKWVKMTKQDFLARCKTLWSMGLANDRALWCLMSRWLDFVMRFEHTWLSHGQSQGQACIDFLKGEQERLGGAYSAKTLASDEDGYRMIQAIAVLCHPCQECASDPSAWHTRSGFCPHKNEQEDTCPKQF